MKKKWHTQLIYLSLIFLLLALYRYDYLIIPKIYSGIKLSISLVFLFLGFFLSALSQQRFLSKSGFHISIRQSIAMVGLNIFTKYIPGKVMTVMGKAYHLAEIKGFPVLPLSVVFLQIQIITLWCGMMAACIGLLFFHKVVLVSWVGLLLFSIFSMAVFSSSFSKWLRKIIKKAFRRDITLNRLSIANIIGSIHWFLGVWLLWGVAFYFFINSLSDQSIAVPAIFCFPLAGTIGIIAIFAPGGVGIRESIIVGFLTKLHVHLDIAITISALSRLWFLAGELFIFIWGSFYRKRG